LVVREKDFSDAALVLLGHGSTRNAGSATPVYQQAVNCALEAYSARFARPFGSRNRV